VEKDYRLDGFYGNVEIRGGGSPFLFRWNEREDLITQLRQRFSMGITKEKTIE